MTGEWLREQFENGEIPGQTENLDLVILLARLCVQNFRFWALKTPEACILNRVT